MDEEYAARLVRAPGEGLTLELKTWLNLDDVGHKVKLIRALLALRNYNGGYVIIGFDDKTGEPSPDPPDDARAAYHVDDLQLLVSTYASDAFDITVAYPNREGVTYPVIQVAAGVQIPVAVKKDIQSGGKTFLRRGEVLFRTLAANGTVSSAPAAPEDWRKIMDICFSNREADLAGFVRRHLLSGELPAVLAELGEIAQRPKLPSLEDTCRSFADVSAARAMAVTVERKLAPYQPGFGTFEVAAVIAPALDGYLADQHLLNRVLQSHPNLPTALWTDTRSYANRLDRHFTTGGGYEAMIEYPSDWQYREFSRIEPSGRFYVQRPYFEDTASRSWEREPGTAIELDTTISMVTDAFATALAFAQSLAAADTPDSRLGVLFRLHNLNGRQLTSFASALDLRIIPRRSNDDEHDRYIEVPVSTAAVNVGRYVSQVVRPLFALFDGYSVTENRVEQQVRRYLERRP